MTLSYSISYMYGASTDADYIRNTIFVYRAFNRLFHSPYMSALEAIITVIVCQVHDKYPYTYWYFLALCAVSIIIDRLIVL
jgi:uncharacterized membrane protein (DUF106 family)